MVSEGDDAPDFTAPLANGDIEEFTLSEQTGDGPVVLAFFPGAFTSTCSHEMNTFEERLDTFQDAGVTVYGLSTDSPFALNEFRDKLGLSFALISDGNREIIDAYDVSMDFDHIGVENISQRAVFIVDTDGTVSYAWVSDDAGVEPDYDELEAAATSAP